jgi:nucleotide-binding universal stress UspA family protein
MALKDIALHVDASKAARARIQLAVGLAARHDAHLTGLFVYPRLTLPVGFAADLPPQFLEAQHALFEEQAGAAEVQFEDLCKHGGVRSEWRATHGDVADALSNHGRYADLIILGQYNEDDPLSVRAGAPDDVIMASGRPVLVVPYIGASTVPGKEVLVAWNASRESSRAANDALPLLIGADKVTVLVLDTADSDTEQADLPGADISTHLARHGVNVEAQHVRASGVDVGNMLLSRAADTGADLIVMGAYGHSRLREWMLGGVTRELLEHMTAPVLLSH